MVRNPPKPPQTSKALPFVLSWWTSHRFFRQQRRRGEARPPFAVAALKRSRLWSNLLPSHRPLQQSHLLPLALGEAVSSFGWRKKVPLVVGSDFFVCSCCFAWWMAGSYKMIVVLIVFLKEGYIRRWSQAVEKVQIRLVIDNGVCVYIYILYMYEY